LQGIPEKLSCTVNIFVKNGQYRCKITNFYFQYSSKDNNYYRTFTDLASKPIFDSGYPIINANVF
jgi:hypothetical protein